MERALNYSFKRRSKSYMDWLYYEIKSEYYIQAESIKISSEINK